MLMLTIPRRQRCLKVVMAALDAAIHADPLAPFRVGKDRDSSTLSLPGAINVGARVKPGHGKVA